MRRDDKAQLNIIESIMVGVIVFTAVAATAVFRLPTSPAAFQQAELERIGNDALAALTAKVPDTYTGSTQILKNCNIEPCPYRNELERIVSLAMDFNNHPEGAKTDPLSDFFNQALPEGSFYVLYLSNAEGEIAISPGTRRPPAADVVVSHALLGPAWTQQALDLDGDVVGFQREVFYLRPGEVTDFDQDSLTDSITSITDPLARTKDQTETSLETRFATLQTGQTYQKVPLATPYGTYKLIAGSTRYFAVVPHGIAGPGSLAYPTDLDPSTSLDGASYNFHAVAGTDGNLLYLDVTDDNKVSAGDLRLSYLESGGRVFPPGSFVDGTDQDAMDNHELSFIAAASQLKYTDENTTTPPSRLEDGEAVYVDVNNDNEVSAGDIRLSRAGTYAMGTVVGADEDLGRVLSAALPNANQAVRWVNVGVDDNKPAKGEAVYLDLSGEGQVSGLEPFDVHLTSRGTVTLRYVYDVRLVVWFGV